MKVAKQSVQKTTPAAALNYTRWLAFHSFTYSFNICFFLKENCKLNVQDSFCQYLEGGKGLQQRKFEGGGRAYVQSFKKRDKLDEVEQPLVLAICTPLMARAHSMIQQAGELIYCDSTASLDRFSCPTFIISTCSAAGGIPLGVVITSGEDENSISEAINFLKTVLPHGAFYGKGSNGPSMCITDDCTAERTAIKNNWPNIEMYLCIFHYLQAGGHGYGTASKEFKKLTGQLLSN